MKILVTGAAGFIGSHLAERLVSLGHEVTGLDCFTDYYLPELKEINAKDLETLGVHIHRLDLAEDDLTEALKDIEIVYHLAAQPGISATVPFENYLKNNFIATFKLIEALKNSPTLKLFVNTATSSVYGAHATDNEEAAPKPTSYYGVTKLAAEQLVLSYFRDKGFPACSIRPFSVYGERERPEKLYPKVIHSILDENFSVPFYEGSEKHLRSYTYVGDIVDGYVSLIDHIDTVKGEIFNFGLDTAITTGEGIKIVEELMGSPARLEVKPKRPGDQAETHATIDKARTMLGYKPTTSPKEGLAKEVEWFKNKVWQKVDIHK